MRTEFETIGDWIEYRLLDVDPVYDDVLRRCFWEEFAEGWCRSYPRTARHLDPAMGRFSETCEEMFGQLASLRPVRWEQALLDFADRAAAHGVSWWLTGSVAACVRGVELEPRDVDIMVDGTDVDQITEVFADWLVEPLVDTGGWLTKDFGVLFQHARIDIASDPSRALDSPEPADCGPYARAHLEQVEFRGRRVAVPPLALLAATNRRRGRLDRAEMIEAAITR